ncbi:hypothetical protein JD844_028040 [Phrynosoma platyrhinos]|uniref:Otogelin n=1 Tax=Phrynosoma platyrhinos TaxID=52577 RepID=A0ABQ7SHD3_PHRPL|nr:hypothetical protein JD844_028040 [Phrynosoma platyrhinos]
MMMKLTAEQLQNMLDRVRMQATQYEIGGMIFQHVCEDTFIHRDCISCCPPTCTFEKDCLGSNLHCLDGCYCPDAFVLVAHGTALNMIALNLDHACIQSITLILEDDINRQVTLNRDGEVQYGYSSQALNLNGYVEIQNLSSLFVQLKTKFGLKIQFAKDGERVYIQLSTDWKRRTLGLCGTYNGNLRDDFLSPAGMIEGTPQLHASAWKVSSACHVPVNIPVVDPCNINQQNGALLFHNFDIEFSQCHFSLAGYASQCDAINQELFAPCHVYINPGLYYQLCRFDACKCGSSCLCNALAHYAHICRKHGISIDFRSQVSYCGDQCQNGTMRCTEATEAPAGRIKNILFSCSLHFTFAVQACPEGKIYYDCRSRVPGLPSAGVNCELSCANLAMNFTCAQSPPCVSGCICPPGMAEHKGKCYVPDSCPCTWKDWEYVSGEVIATPCYTCICRHGVFNCTYYPCPAVCTIYGDRHYYTFDGLEYDYVSDCQVYLVKGASSSNLSVIVQNKKCFDNDIVCSKNLFISVGDAEIFFSEPLDLQRMLKKHENKSKYQLWKAGFYTAVHFPEQEITVLWDRKTTIHIKAGARWKGKLSGLCGNFDKYTSNDLTTSNNMEIKNAQLFGESWAIGQCANPNETIKPCEVHQGKFPYAKKECSVLYSDVFAPCRNMVTYDCDYYNQGLGEGPYILASYGQNDTVIGVNITSKKIFPLPRISISGNVYFNFMLTPGLFKDKILCYSAFELHRKKGFFIILTTSAVKVSKYDNSEEFKRSSSFSIEELHSAVPYRRMCEWRYDPCTSPCVKTCSDPEGTACRFLPPVEGCLPYCPKDMILDEVTLKCVYPEDCECIPVKPTESSSGTKPTLLSTHLVDTMETSSQTPPKFVTEGVELIYINLTTEITTEKIKSKEQMLTDLHSSPSFHTSTNLLDSYSATTPSALLGSTSATTFPATSISTATIKTTSYSTSPTFFMSFPTETTAIQPLTTFPLITTSTKPLGSTFPSATVATLPVGQGFASAEIPTSLLTTRGLSTSPSPVSIDAATQFLLIERQSLPSPVLFTHSPSTHTFTVISRSKPYLSAFSSTMSPVPLFTSRFTVFDKRPLYSISSSDSMTMQPDSKTETKTLLHTSVSSQKIFLTPEYIVPLTKHFTTTANIHSGISSAVAPQRPTTMLSSLGLNVTHAMSTLVMPPITSQRPKATGEVTVVSKSFHIGPSTGSFPYVPQASKPFLASTVPRESKHALHKDSSAVPSVFMSSSEFVGTRALPSSTSVLPIKLSYDMVQTTSKASMDIFVPHTELKASSVVHSADASTTSAEFSGTSSFTSPSVLLTVLTRSSTPQISVSASHSKISSITPQAGTTTALIPTATHIQLPLGEKSTSRSPDSYVAASHSVIPLSSADMSTIDTTYLPPMKVSDEAVLSREATSSLTTPMDNRTLSSLQSTFSTQFAEPTTEPTTVGALSNITSVLAYVTEKYSLSPSVSLPLSSVSITGPAKTVHVTEFSPVSFKFHTATESVPATSQKSMYAPNTTLFTPRLSTETFRTMPTKMTEVTTSSGVELSMAQTSELKNATTTYALASNQTSEIQESAHTKELSMLPIQVTSSISEGSTEPVKPISLSDVTDITASDWSRVPPPKSFGPYYSVTEPQQIRISSSPNITIIDSSHSPAVSLGTQTSQMEMKVMATESAEYASFGTVTHSLMSATSPECMPRYLDPVDQCTQYVCINMGWMLYNLSRNCHKNVEKPDCGFRGMPVQINSDSCCPEWECPCQCSVLSELSIITFDGNNLALYKLASYILVKLPTEIIVAHIEKCPTNQVRNLLLINRLARKVVVDAVIQTLPFLKHGLCIQDTGAMYVINTPAGINIKWAHVTGIIDIQYGFHSNASTKTEGLCGVCNGDPVDDWKMQNRTVITNMEEIEAFIKSWEIEKSIDVTTRRLVSPQDFCEKMWINNTYFWNYECDALSAYVALCNKHNICIKWRTPDYCALSCPDGKEYQPCVQPCAAKTCLNKWFYEESPCSYLREDCVCKNGTILHRTDSDLCIPEEKCACTDNEGHPHSAEEVWNGSNKGCCMYKCLENGSIISIEPECKKEPPPICEREGEVIINIIEERACCPKKVCECNMTLCDSIIPKCKNMEKLVVGYSPYSCCPQYRCECDPSACPNASRPECREDQFIVEAKQEDLCCFSYLCVCESCIEPIPLCNDGEILTVDRSTTHYCCPHYHCVCDETLCHLPLLNCSVDMKLVKKRVHGQCCPDWTCECNCDNLTAPACKVGEVQRIDSSLSSMCGCPQYICEKDNVCVFQEVTILSPGQSMIQYLDGDLCYTAKCSQERDPNTGFHAMDLTIVNCSQKCEAHQVYVPSLSQHSCCGSCINMSCPFDSGNGTLVIHKEGSTWVSNCIKYECTKTAIGAIVLGSSIICPPFNETECTKNGGTVLTYNDGCCKTCKKDDRICQKVTVRTTIRKHDCISQSPINMSSCDGKCPSATIFNVNINSHLRFCKCCRENGVQNLTVPLYCSGNGTEIMYVIQEPTDCSCQWT